MAPSAPVSIFAALDSEELNGEERQAVGCHSYLLAHSVIGAGFLVGTLITVWLIQVTSGQPSQALSAQEEIHRTVLGHEMARTLPVADSRNSQNIFCVLLPHELDGSPSLIDSLETAQRVETYGKCKASVLPKNHRHHFIKLGIVDWHYGHRASLLLDHGLPIRYVLQRSQGRWRVIERRIQLQRI
jgi:hypothetical protein